MDIQCKKYPKDKSFNSDFFSVFNFLLKYGAMGNNQNWHWGRWEWLIGHSNLDVNTLPQIGIFELNNEVIGIATHDMRLGKAYIVCNPEFSYAKEDMLKYVNKELAYENSSGIFIDDKDTELITLAQQYGYVKSDVKEYVLTLDCQNGKYIYDLPKEYTISDYSLSQDLNKYYRVLWKGFNHEGLPPHIDKSDVIDRPHENPQLAVFVVALDGEYVSHCGT